MTQRLITHLRHVDLAVPDLAQAARLLHQHLGPHGRAQRLRADLPRRRGLARSSTSSGCGEATDKRIDLISFGAAHRRRRRHPRRRSWPPTASQLVSEPGTLQTPGGGYGFRFFDNEGRTVEISSDVAVRQHRKIEEGESIPVRLSHVVINSADPEGTRAFYEKHLAFALSDTLMHPRMGEMMWFMRINAWHHSMAIARGPHPSLHHASFEMRGIDEYMRGTGRLLRAGVEKIWGPGRHLAGNNTFSYFLDPHGNTVEYTTELELVDEDTWHPHMYDFSNPEVSDQWGTANAMNEFVAQKSFNDPDKGLFVAPPV